MKKLKIIVSGGGTGGHIFPAIAIADAIKKKQPETEFLFVGAKGKMEMEKVPQAGYKIVALPIVGLQRRLTSKNLAFPFKLLKSVLKAKSIIKEFQPDLAIGVGGYASGPILRAANRLKVPTLIQEQNSYAGLTNKILAKRASRICVAYPGMERYFPKDKIVITGNPVRSELTKLEGKRKRAMEEFGLDEEKKTLLVVGGSLGAWSINEAVEQSIDSWKKEGFQLIWQCGKLFFDRAVKAAASEKSWIHLTPFIQRMDLAYAAADLVVSRAGAIAVSELSIAQKPVILIPLPSAAEDHQTKNAQVLLTQNAGKLIPDREVRKKLLNEVIRLIHQEEELQQMSTNIRALAHHDAAELIADEALKLIKNK